MNCSTKHAEQLHEGKRIARLFCDFEIELTPDNLRESSYAMLKITDVGTFEINPEITMDQFDKMLRLNGMATLIPIIRGIVLNVSSTLMVRIPMLVPNINVTQIEWEKSKQEE
ncbi:MAG TPA: hypothetical protein PKN45_10865, partial [Candidatus Limiplasma sp.]|nr:hypothetical protein [Candidatus Limiplasma sp.]